MASAVQQSRKEGAYTSLPSAPPLQTGNFSKISLQIFCCRPDISIMEHQSFSLKPSLPLELVHHIIDHIADDYYGGRPHVRVRSLRRCRLVCREWSLIARRPLFSTVAVQNDTTAGERDVVAFLALAQESPWLCPTVKHLRVYGLYRLHELVAVISKLPRLRIISLSQSLDK